MKRAIIGWFLFSLFLGGAQAQLVVNNNQLWTQNSDGLGGEAADGDEFGEAIATGKGGKATANGMFGLAISSGENGEAYANAAQGKSAPGVNTDASAEKGTEKPKPPPRFFGGSKAAAIDWPDDPPAAAPQAPQAPQQQQNAAPVQGTRQ